MDLALKKKVPENPAWEDLAEAGRPEAHKNAQVIFKKTLFHYLIGEQRLY